MEINIRFEDRPVRSVSMRHLSRRTSSLLDELAEDGGAVLIVRYGYPVAVLAPIDDPAIKPSRAYTSTPSPETERSIPELNPVQREILSAVAERFPYSWNLNEWSGPQSDMLVAVTRLERAGFIERAAMGVRATSLGRRAVCLPAVTSE